MSSPPPKPTNPPPAVLPPDPAATGRWYTPTRYDRRTQDILRSRIPARRVIVAVYQHLMGRRELSPTQVACGKILLDRVLPTLSATTLEAVVDVRAAEQCTDAELVAIIREEELKEEAARAQRTLDAAPAPDGVKTN